MCRRHCADKPSGVSVNCVAMPRMTIKSFYRPRYQQSAKTSSRLLLCYRDMPDGRMRESGFSRDRYGVQYPSNEAIDSNRPIKPGSSRDGQLAAFVCGFQRPRAKIQHEIARRNGQLLLARSKRRKKKKFEIPRVWVVRSRSRRGTKARHAQVYIQYIHTYVQVCIAHGFPARFPMVFRRCAANRRLPQGLQVAGSSCAGLVPRLSTGRPVFSLHPTCLVEADRPGCASGAFSRRIVWSRVSTVLTPRTLPTLPYLIHWPCLVPKYPGRGR